MRQITDYFILILYCLIAQFEYPIHPAFVSAFLLAVCISAFLYVFPSNRLYLALTAGYGLLLFALPEALLMLPLVLYSFAFPSENRKEYFSPNFVIPVVLCLSGAVFQMSHSRSTFLFFYIGCGCILSVVLHKKSVSYGQLLEKYKKTRDDGKENALLLEEKNRSLLSAQDAEIYTATLKERNRIAREIHDNVGHLLTRSILLVGALKTLHPESSLEEPLSQLDDTLNSAMNSIRESVHNLYDRSVDLPGSLRSLTENFLFCPAALHYDMTSDVPAEVRYCFIAVTKEALSNVSRHSNATKVFVSAVEHPAFYQLSIWDNGKNIPEVFRSGSFDPAALSARCSGIGLSGMQTRVAALHGTFRINADNGFHIFVTIPNPSLQKGKEPYANFTDRR